MWLLCQEILWHVNTPIIKGLLTPPRLRSEKEFRITLQKIVLQSYAEYNVMSFLHFILTPIPQHLNGFKICLFNW